MNCIQQNGSDRVGDQALYSVQVHASVCPTVHLTGLMPVNLYRVNVTKDLSLSPFLLCCHKKKSRS